MFDLTDEYEALRESVRRLAEERIAPNAAAADENEEYPPASWEAWRDAGFAGLAFPEDYGGQGGGILAHAIASRRWRASARRPSLFTFISKLGMSTAARPRLRGAQAEVRPSGRGRRRASVVLPLRGRRGQRRRGHADRVPCATVTTTS